MTTRNIIGTNIRKHRDARGYTQKRLGELAGKRDVTQINAYENGRSQPTRRVLTDIADALGVSVADLEGVTTTSPTPESATNLIAALRKFVDETNLPVSAARIVLEITA